MFPPATLVVLSEWHDQWPFDIKARQRFGHEKQSVEPRAWFTFRDGVSMRDVSSGHAELTGSSHSDS